MFPASHRKLAPTVRVLLHRLSLSSISINQSECFCLFDLTGTHQFCFHYFRLLLTNTSLYSIPRYPLIIFNTSMKRDIIDCNSDSQGDAFLGLRIASIFVIYIGSSCGALFPVLARRSKFINVPKSLFEYVSYKLLDALSLNNDPPSSIRFAKFFGSGVIVRDAFFFVSKCSNRCFPLQDRDCVHSSPLSCVG